MSLKMILFSVAVTAVTISCQTIDRVVDPESSAAASDLAKTAERLEMQAVQLRDRAAAAASRGDAQEAWRLYAAAEVMERDARTIRAGMTRLETISADLVDTRQKARDQQEDISRLQAEVAEAELRGFEAFFAWQARLWKIAIGVLLALIGLIVAWSWAWGGGAGLMDRVLSLFRQRAGK